MKQITAGKSKCIKDAQDLSNEAFRMIVGKRFRQEVDPKFGPVSDEKTRRSIEKKLTKHLEKIHEENNLLPAKFLADGSQRAKAVCRIRTTSGFGTGILIDRKFIMTNNHVLETSEEAAASVAEFGFEAGTSPVQIALRPNEFFLTNSELDYTVVACDEVPHDIEPVPLRRNPTLVTRGDRVNIIQHPMGEHKQVAVHDNHVIRVKDKVIHYRTDTQPGSSGSPVFNNDWELVALHHAGWKDGSKAINEGIRIPAIVSDLLLRSRRAGGELSSLGNLLATVPDTSPFLGFFDMVGLTDGTEAAIDLPLGNSPNFADVGFWNIEHFNNGVSSQKVKDVARMVAWLSLDLFGLVEVENNALDRLCHELSGSHGQSYSYELLNVGGSQDLAVLYDSEKANVTLREDIYDRYRDQLKRKTPSGKSAFPRWPLFAECTVREGGGEVKFLMIVVHFKAFGDFQSRSRRKLASEILSEIINEIRDNENIGVVLGGDFNEAINTSTLSSLRDNDSLVALTTDDEADGYISYVGRRHRSLIDHIIVSRDLRLGDVAGDDAVIVRLDRSVDDIDFAERISDHRPLTMRIVYRGDDFEQSNGRVHKSEKRGRVLTLSH